MAQPELRRVVVVGASLAGLRACETLRSEGFTGSVTLIGAEARRPYDRPPLSKKLLAGDWEPDRIALRRDDDLDALGLDLRLGVPAAALDVDGGLVHLADGSRAPFDAAVLATGSRPRRLPGQESVAIVHELRTLDDALRLRAEIADGTARVVVVGAGFIGLEVAATARARGCEVVVLEGAPAPLIRGLGAEMGAAVAGVHATDGIDVRCGVMVEGLDEDGVRLLGGELVPADVIVVGVGVAPATEWLEDSGLELRDGVVVDASLAVPDGRRPVYAAGDIARWPNDLFGEEMRVEHWTNAAEQGAVAAHNVLAAAAGGQPERYAPVPFFWSDQGRQRVQFLGRSSGDEPGDEVEVVAGDLEGQRFVVLYGRRGRLWGALGLNAPKLVMPYRRHLAAAMSWDDAVSFAHTQQS